MLCRRLNLAKQNAVYLMTSHIVYRGTFITEYYQSVDFNVGRMEGGVGLSAVNRPVPQDLAQQLEQTFAHRATGVMAST